MRSAWTRHTPQATSSGISVGPAEHSEIPTGRSVQPVVVPGALVLRRTRSLGWISVLASVLGVLAVNQVAVQGIHSPGLLPLAMAISVLATVASYRGIAAHIRAEHRRETDLADAARRHGVRLAANTIRHHIGNKLAVVVGYTELLADDPRLPPDVREQANKAMTNAIAAAEVVHKLDSQLVRVELDSSVAGTQLLSVDPRQAPGQL